jgi:hypothetical protein
VLSMAKNAMKQGRPAWQRWVVKGAIVGAVVLAARSKNRVMRTAGRVGGAFVAPRIVPMLARRS